MTKHPVRAMLWAMLILAHRGFRTKEYSENTPEAFQEAIRQGADGIELDMRVSRDGEIVIVHDKNLHRIAGDAHTVGELTAKELSQIQLRNGGTIPTLNDVTATIPAPAILDLEVKHKDVTAPLIAKLKTSAALRDRCVISSYHAGVLQRIKSECPDTRTLLLIARWPLPLRTQALWKKITKLSPWAVAFPEVLLRKGRIQKLRSLGVRVGAWDWHDRATLRSAKRAVALELDFAIVRQISAARAAIDRKKLAKDTEKDIAHMLGEG